MNSRNTRFEMSKGDLSCEKLPQTQCVAEHVGLDGIAGALGEHLWSHPTKVLESNTGNSMIQLVTQNATPGRT